MAVPDKLIDHYLKHRRARHARVLNAVQAGTTELTNIAAEAYADTPDAHPGLAVDQTLSHLLAHEADGAVSQSNGTWSVVE